ncbi:hypothetical protein RFI_16273, partial [Reticulomyxa filosa]
NVSKGPTDKKPRKDPDAKVVEAYKNLNSSNFDNNNFREEIKNKGATFLIYLYGPTAHILNEKLEEIKKTHGILNNPYVQQKRREYLEEMKNFKPKSKSSQYEHSGAHHWTLKDVQNQNQNVTKTLNPKPSLEIYVKKILKLFLILSCQKKRLSVEWDF